MRHLTWCLTPPAFQSAHASGPAWLLYPALQLQPGALNLMISKCSRIRADNETRYPLPFHALQPPVAEACKSSHKRCTIERLSPSLFHSPTLGSFIPSRSWFLPVVKARCQPLHQSRADCPHPLCKWFTTTRLTRSFCALLPSSIPHFFRFSLYLLHSAILLSHTFLFILCFMIFSHPTIWFFFLPLHQSFFWFLLLFYISPLTPPTVELHFSHCSPHLSSRSSSGARQPSQKLPLHFFSFTQHTATPATQLTPGTSVKAKASLP